MIHLDHNSEAWAQLVRTTKALTPSTDTLDQYRENVAAEVEQNLSVKEKSLIASLDDLGTQFADKFTIIAEAEATLKKPFAEEILVIRRKTTTADGREVEEKVEVQLGDRMEAFAAYVHAQTDHIARLWDEWTGIQAELVCLAVEILGLDEVELCGKAIEKYQEEMGESLTNAEQKRNAHSLHHGDLVAKLSDFEDKIQDITSKADHDLKEQEKVSDTTSFTGLPLTLVAGIEGLQDPTTERASKHNATDGRGLLRTTMYTLRGPFFQHILPPACVSATNRC